MKVFRGMKSNDESGILAFTNVRNPCSHKIKKCAIYVIFPLGARGGNSPVDRTAT